MSFLLDTNVVSEWVKPHPNPGVVSWLGEVDEEQVFISVVTIGELRHGIEGMQTGARRNRLDHWLTDDLPLRFERRILAVEERIADTWGKIMVKSRKGGRRMAAMDALIAATALVHNLKLVTRNVSDFAMVGTVIVNPWSQ